MSQIAPRRPRPTRRSHRHRLGAAALAAAATSLVAAASAGAYNAVPAANGDYWGIHDAHMPGLDTGSVRNMTASNALRGFGGIQVRVSGGRADDPSLRLNGELMRGFGLRYDGERRFRTTNAVNLGGVVIERSIYVESTSTWARWLDSFTNTVDRPITVEVVFGGATGYGATGNNSSRVVETSSGDALVTTADTWSLVASPLVAQGGRSFNGPSGVVFGTPSPFTGSLQGPTNWLYRSFDTEIAGAGHDANFQGYRSRLTLQPGETQSLAHFVVVGAREATAAQAGTEVAGVRALLTQLAAAPEFGDLTAAQICSIQNWDVSGLAVAGFDPASCAALIPQEPEATPQFTPATTSSPYNVVGKTITQMQADMEAGVTTSQEITRAYLDRIAAYDTGQFGFHSFTHVAADAMEQATRADERRAAGESGGVLGIPVAPKDLYDTKDMPTTNGSWAFEGFLARRDAFQIRKLREAGAVILGKATMAEYANSGHYSESAWGQVWNAFNPSKSSIGSSGGSAVATSLSLTGFALGSQTGDSLWGPSSAASLVSLRGTDGMQSSQGVMPLTWLQDYAGAITRSIPDLAAVLNVVTGTDPEDPMTAEADRYRPEDWTEMLDADALRGKVIGYIPARFEDPFGTTGTSEAMLASLAHFVEAGATLKAIGPEPASPGSTAAFGDRGYQGWQNWLDDHPEAPFTNPVEIITTPKRLPYSRRPTYTGAGPMTATQQQDWKDYRQQYKALIAEWMDREGVDAVVYAGLLSDVLLNDGPNPSFGRVDPPHSAAGIPAMIFPAGVNDHGEPINLQLIGRAWDDAKLLGYAHAFDLRAQGHVEPGTAPALPYDPDVRPAPIVIETPAPPISPTPTPEPPTNQQPSPTPPAVTPPAVTPLTTRTAVRLRPSYRLTRVGTTTRLRVRATLPSTLGGRTVLVQRRVGSRVVTLGRLRVGATGRVNATLRIPSASAYRVRLSMAATPTTTASRTSFALLRSPVR